MLSDARETPVRMYWFVHFAFSCACGLLLLSYLLLCYSNKLLERVDLFDTRMGELRVSQINITLAITRNDEEAHATAVETFGRRLADTDEASVSI